MESISAGLIIIIVPLVLGWLLRGAGTTTKKSNGTSWLVYGNRIKGFVLFFVAIVGALVVVLFNVEPKDKMPVLGVIGLFGGLTLPMALETFFVRIGYDSEKIYCESVWRRNRIIDWGEVESVKYSQSMRWWVVQTRHSGRIYVSEYISGRVEFLEELRKRTVGLVSEA